jgi:hypothetical protein
VAPAAQAGRAQIGPVIVSENARDTSAIDQHIQAHRHFRLYLALRPTCQHIRSSLIDKAAQRAELLCGRSNAGAAGKAVLDGLQMKTRLDAREARDFLRLGIVRVKSIKFATVLKLVSAIIVNETLRGAAFGENNLMLIKFNMIIGHAFNARRLYNRDAIDEAPGWDQNTININRVARR